MSWSWSKQVQSKPPDEQKPPTISVKHWLKYIACDDEKNIDIPTQKEVTPDSADDFEMTNAGNFAKPNLPKGKPIHAKLTKKKPKIRKRTPASLDIMNKDFSFHTPYSELISAKPDTYLNEIITVKYFRDSNGMTVQGRLTCISHTGQYKLEHVLYKDGVDVDKPKLNDCYWLHFNSTRKIYLCNYKCYKRCEELNKLESIDITQRFCDIVKFKLMTNLFQENKYEFRWYDLMKENINNALQRIKNNESNGLGPIGTLKQITIQKIKEPSSIQAIRKFIRNSQKNEDRYVEKTKKESLRKIKQYVYATRAENGKINIFKYLERKNWNTKAKYLKDGHIVAMIIGYRDLIVEHFESIDLNERHNIKLVLKVKKKDDHDAKNLEYFNWD